MIERNKLDPTIREAERFGIFKSNILKFIRPIPKSFLNCFFFFLNFFNNQSPIESISYFFPHCPLFDDKTITVLSTLNYIDCKLIGTN